MGPYLAQLLISILGFGLLILKTITFGESLIIMLIGFLIPIISKRNGEEVHKK